MHSGLEPFILIWSYTSWSGRCHRALEPFMGSVGVHGSLKVYIVVWRCM